MANGASGLADLLTLLLCCGLLNAATRRPPPPPPQREIIYVQRPPGTYAKAGGEGSVNESVHACATNGGDLPLIACAHAAMDRELEGSERV